ncbi:MAG: sigma 54-interacting transcriptional regulator [Firmicutes bacterium]|nr:sigma 54-interacting transcriptional regulator [Bacillota bacterium]
MEETQRYHADPTIPVLIFGETGTGKEIVARLIHFGTGDTTTPLKVNYSAMRPGPLPGDRARGSGENWIWPRGEPSFWMKYRKYPSIYRQNYFGFWKKKNTTGWGG